MEESSPLSPRIESQNSVRRNLFRTIQHKLYSSYLLLTFSLLLTLVKIISTGFILTTQETDSGAPLLLWNSVSLILDSVYIFLKLCQLPYIKRSREGEEVDEYFLLQIAFIVHTLCVVIWQLPGNIWYWRCKECYDNAPVISGLTLANLILGYLYLLLPALVLVSICACLPVAIIFVMVISDSSQFPASDDLLNKLTAEDYSPEKHLGDPSCTICTVEYGLGDKITIMQCDARHFFHYECIKKWLKINANCPICRAPYVLD